jgi:pyridoxine 5-phosphate synthase
LKRELNVELNIEGNPLHKEFVELLIEVRPAQATLVPDAAGALTSDSGWDLESNGPILAPIIARLKAAGIRVSLFLDTNKSQIDHAKSLGTDRIELYTKPYADAFGELFPIPISIRDSGTAMSSDRVKAESCIQPFREAAIYATKLGLGVNAGHDLSLQNLAPFCTIPGLLEVSIGHALVCDALEIGLSSAVRAYRDQIKLGNDAIGVWN